MSDIQFTAKKEDVGSSFQFEIQFPCVKSKSASYVCFGKIWNLHSITFTHNLVWSNRRNWKLERDKKKKRDDNDNLTLG